MPQITMKALLESGVHFGHQTKRWNPKMKPYIFAARNGIYIIDLQKTLKYTKEASQYLRKVIRNGEKVLFVGTKKQAKEAVKEEAIRCGMPYVATRWLGGILTNFTTIRSRVARLNQLETMEATGEFERYPVKERMSMQKELKKLQDNLGGLKEMDALPGAIFVIDVKREENAVREANKLGVATVAVVDTNCDPDGIDKIIPGNDDAIRAVRLMCKIMADTIIEEKIAMEKEKETAVKQEEAEAVQNEIAEDAENSSEAAAIANDTTDYSKVFGVEEDDDVDDEIEFEKHKAPKFRESSEG